MIGLIMNLINKFGNLVVNKIPSKSTQEVESENTETANETNREEKTSGKGSRNSLGYVCAFIIP